MFARKTRIAGIVAVVAAIAGAATLAGPVSQASAGLGGDNGAHYVLSTCTTKHISVQVSAASAFNGQQVATRVWDRVPGGAWTAMTGWRINSVYSQRTFDDGFGSPITSTTPQTLYTLPITTTGGYRQIGVEFYWAVNGVWTGYDFLVEDTYNQGSPIGFLTTGTCVT
jgi:hypothetical protein